MQEKVCLQVENISKSFPGVKVFSGFDFDLREGEIHCICGENGAGKTTLIKILSGAYAPDEGVIYFEGKKLDRLNPHLAIALGIQTIYQEHTLFPLLSVAENLFVGREEGGLFVDKQKMREKAREIFKDLNADIDPDTIVQYLGSGKKKIVEIARGLIQESKVMILDEPTASLGEEEIDNLFKVLRKLKQKGVSIIYISHRLEEVFKIADRVTVIRDGAKINTYEIEDVTEEKIIKDMIGRDISTFYKGGDELLREHSIEEELVFEARNLSGNGVKNASLYVRKGELLGIAGMVGSGRTELAELLFGVKPADSGEIRINGKKASIASPKEAILNGMCFITEDRQGSGLFLELPVVDNLVMANYTNTKSELVSPREDAQKAKEYVEKLNIVTPTIYQKVVFLSGGNQQKVILGKWFLTDGQIFIFDEPTVGIDVGAKEEIYKLMISLLREGKSIIMISSDMMELIAMSDRINVMRDGEIVAELKRDDFSEENILKYSIGVY
ncbi:MAG: inositol transport system ATP-binding protein [Candidatus Atribacteria bacterium]|nr:inositol transport system ATP-binding protein [Candidatus Atribacteria bacterium]